jgi:hypothetical protein
MTAQREAMKAAMDLLILPARLRGLQAAPVPREAAFLMRVAAGDPEAGSTAVAITGRPLEKNQKAAEFFLEQVLLMPDADSYRTLGALPNAPSHEIRQNMALLLKWLHPDLAHKDQRPVLASRVIAAWENLKTPERRLAYDTSQRLRCAKEPEPLSGRAGKVGKKRVSGTTSKPSRNAVLMNSRIAPIGLAKATVGALRIAFRSLFKQRPPGGRDLKSPK